MTRPPPFKGSINVKRPGEAEFVIGGYVPGPNGVASVPVGQERANGV